MKSIARASSFTPFTTLQNCCIETEQAKDLTKDSFLELVKRSSGENAGKGVLITKPMTKEDVLRLISTYVA